MNLWMELQNMTDELLQSTIAELEARGESLELVRLRLEQKSRRREQLLRDGKLKRRTVGYIEPVPSLEFFLERFWNKVERRGESECWHWIGCFSHSGYGTFTFYFCTKKKIYSSHRFAYMTTGATISTGLHIRHKCDNPKCCNPSHLLIGTHTDNMRDIVLRGRRGIGSKHHMAKLDESQVLEILKSTKSMRVIAKEYGVSSSVVFDIKKRKTWRNVVFP